LTAKPLDEQPADAVTDAAAAAANAADTTDDSDNLGVTVEKKLTSEVTETVTVTGTCIHQRDGNRDFLRVVLFAGGFFGLSFNWH